MDLGNGGFAITVGGLGPIAHIAEFCIERERLRHYLVHVVVLVGREPAHEVNTGIIGKFPVLVVNLGVFGAGYWIIGIPFSLRVLIDDAGFGMLLAGEMFEFSNSREGRIIRVIHDGYRLMLRLVEGLVFKFEAAIREFAELEIEKLIYGSGVDDFAIRDDVFYLTVVSVEEDPDVWMV